MIKVGWRNQILRRMRYFIKILDRESSFEIEGEGKFRFSRKLNLPRILYISISLYTENKL